MKNIPANFFTEEEWESLCDGCGACCLYKVIDPDTDEIRYTSLVCPFLNRATARCKSYTKRFDLGVGCTNITLDAMSSVWICLPRHCAYRRIYEGREIPSWHPLWLDTSLQGQVLQTKIHALNLQPAEGDPALSDVQEIIRKAQFPDPSRKLEKQLVRKILKNDIF